MKLLYIANIRYPTEKAHGVQISKMCEAFADAGNEVTLLATNRGTPIAEDPFLYYGVRRNFTVHRISVPNIIWLGPIGYWMESISFCIASLFSMHFVRPDAVYTRDPLQVIAAKLAGVRIVFWESHTAYRNSVAKISGRLASHIVSISGGIKTVLIEQGIAADKVSVEHDGADLNEFTDLPTKKDLRTKIGIPQVAVVIEYVGKRTFLGKPKGVEEIIEAFAEAREHCPNIFLLLVGLNPDEIEPVQALAKRVEIPSEQYLFMPHVPRSRVPEYLAAADVLVMNYPNTEYHARLMSPLKLFEYMASGAAILSSDLPVIREVLSEDTAVLVPSDSVQALTGGMVELATDGALRKRLGSAARAAVAHYTWQERARRIAAKIQAAREEA